MTEPQVSPDSDKSAASPNREKTDYLFPALEQHFDDGCRSCRTVFDAAAPESTGVLDACDVRIFDGKIFIPAASRNIAAITLRTCSQNNFEKYCPHYCKMAQVLV